MSYGTNGGKREGAGRKPGSKNTKNVVIAREAAALGITPIEYLLSLMRDEGQTVDIRLDAARTAAPYIHPRLSSVESKIDLTGHEKALEELK